MNKRNSALATVCLHLSCAENAAAAHYDVHHLRKWVINNAPAGLMHSAAVIDFFIIEEIARVE